MRRGDIEVKIEVNFVLRGTVRPVQRTSLTPKARETLLADLEIPVVSLEDMYGGKLVAALDRQHPRDLFDVMQLFAHEGITSDIRRAFVVYLASHNRPIHEVRKSRAVHRRRTAEKGKRGGIRVIYHWWLEGAQFWLGRGAGRAQGPRRAGYLRRLRGRLGRAAGGRHGAVPPRGSIPYPWLAGLCAAADIGGKVPLNPCASGNSALQQSILRVRW